MLACNPSLEDGDPSPDFGVLEGVFLYLHNISIYDRIYYLDSSVSLIYVVYVCYFEPFRIVSVRFSTIFLISGEIKGKSLGFSLN